MLAIPSRIAPAFFNRSTTVASYGGRNPARTLEAQVVGVPRTQMLSLTSTGIPQRGIPRHVGRSRPFLAVKLLEFRKSHEQNLMGSDPAGSDPDGFSNGGINDFRDFKERPFPGRGVR